MPGRPAQWPCRLSGIGPPGVATHVVLEASRSAKLDCSPGVSLTDLSRQLQRRGPSRGGFNRGRFNRARKGQRNTAAGASLASALCSKDPRRLTTSRLAPSRLRCRSRRYVGDRAFAVERVCRGSSSRRVRLQPTEKRKTEGFFGPPWLEVRSCRPPDRAAGRGWSSRLQVICHRWAHPTFPCVLLAICDLD